MVVVVGTGGMTDMVDPQELVNRPHSICRSGYPSVRSIGVVVLVTSNHRIGTTNVGAGVVLVVGVAGSA